MTDDASDKQAEYDDYSTAAGRLFLTWANLENTLSATLRLHLQQRLSKPRGSKEDERIGLAAAIYGSMRLKTSRAIIKRILEHEKASQRQLDFHNRLFEQIAHIEFLRDTLAHQYTRPSDEPNEWILLDAATTKTFYRPKAYQIGTLSILMAAADLHATAMRTGDILPSDARKRLDLTLPAWRYKPSMLKLLPHKRLLSLRERWLRPEPSRG